MQTIQSAITQNRVSEYSNGLRISRTDLQCKQPHAACSKSNTFNIPNRASTVIKLILRCKPQNTGVSSSKAIQTSKQMQMYKSERMQAKQMKGAVCSCTCAHKLLPYYTHACVCVCGVCVCVCVRVCVCVCFTECAHMRALSGHRHARASTQAQAHIHSR